NRNKRPFRKSTMANLPASGTESVSNLAYRKWRKVIVKHESLRQLSFKGVYLLLIITRSQCSYHHNLCFTPCKEGRPMGAWKKTHLPAYRSYVLVTPTIYSPLFINHEFANQVSFQIVKYLSDLSAHPRKLWLQGFNRVSKYLLNSFSSFRFG